MKIKNLNLILCFIFITNSLAAQNITLTGDTPWVVAKNQPEPMQRALEDVKRDWYKVLGRRPIILRKPPQNYNGPIVYMGAKGKYLEDLEPEHFPGEESFNLKVTKDADGRKALVASGADMRGAMYAAYGISKQFLGVDPWYFWTDHQPEYRGEVNVPTDYNRTFGPPTIRFRGWFINDEDLLHGYSNDPMRENVFSLSMWNHIYETILRLHGNMVVPGTFTFPDEKSQILASKRGLYINQHHILPVGLNTFQWPENVPFSLVQHPDIMKQYWKETIQAYKGRDVVWTVGFRGKHDRPFWEDEPGIKTDSARGSVISEAIADQVKLIRQMQPDAPIITNLWMEGVKMYKKGYLTLPEGVSIVWPDNGFGEIRDQGFVQHGQGAYYHTAMRNGEANQLTEMVNPGRIYRNIGRFIRKGATNFLLVNVSDVRPVPLSTDCVMDLAWNAKPYLDRSDQENMEAFYHKFAKIEYNGKIADGLADLYDQYFRIPYLKNHLGEDHFYEMVERYPPDSLEQSQKRGLSAYLQNNISRLEEYIVYTKKLLTHVKKFKSHIPAGRKEFYNQHLLSQTRLHLSSQKMAHTYFLAELSILQDNKKQAITQLNSSLSEFDNMQNALRLGENGQWRGFYYYNVLSPFNYARAAIRKRLATIQNQPVPPLYQKIERGDYEEMYNYQKKFSKNFPLMYPAYCLDIYENNNE